MALASSCWRCHVGVLGVGVGGGLRYIKLRALVDLGVVFIGHGLMQDFQVCLDLLMFVDSHTQIMNLFVPADQILDTSELFYIEASSAYPSRNSSPSPILSSIFLARHTYIGSAQARPSVPGGPCAEDGNSTGFTRKLALAFQ